MLFSVPNLSPKRELYSAVGYWDGKKMQLLRPCLLPALDYNLSQGKFMSIIQWHLLDIHQKVIQALEIKGYGRCIGASTL